VFNVGLNFPFSLFTRIFATRITTALAIDWNKDYYAVLQVPRFSPAADIKVSYRKLAKRYHPDINPGDKGAEEKFKEINMAYDVLSDEQNKLIYDNRLRNPYGYPHGQFQDQQQTQYRQYQQARYEELLRRQRAEEFRRAREAAGERNYDINPWRIVLIVVILINFVRACTHSPIIP
jgi:hypothetical protein